MAEITSDTFGTIFNRKTKNTETVTRHTLKKDDLTVRLISYGATIQSIEAPDRNGRTEDVVLGFENIAGYESDVNPYFGAVIGRFANRISNGSFKLDGTTYNLALNAGSSHLHGGIIGFNKVNWHSYVNNNRVVFTYLSPDGEEGYPGDLLSTVIYELNDNVLSIRFEAVCTKSTIVNLTNHTYFNLAGQGSGSKGMYNHIVHINADHITVLDENMTATGEIKPIAGTEYDLRTPKNVGEGIKSLKENGYDFNYCLNRPEHGGEDLTCAASAVELGSGRSLLIYTDQPGIQFYTGNFIPDGVGKRGTRFGKHSAFCFETQNYPNSVNISSFPNAVLRPSEQYVHNVSYKFGIYGSRTDATISSVTRKSADGQLEN